ncbi:ribulose-phosphate 3-epimerase [Propionispira arboris]|uniref:ribulose-phosphate 3-epimerase n=1 Tax=Propionispira arboris TaxID=84035 RepID=UPI00115FBA54|nr:ribulose-phosphate 3-epimerase [Propionispira arboris]
MVSLKKYIEVSPSLICADLCNLEQEVNTLQKAGMRSLHVDIIDPHFSPSMPIGLSSVEQLKAKSSMDFDVHIMSTDNEFFIKKLVKIKPASIIFHYESGIHVEKMLQLIKEADIKAGIALNPATPLDVLEYVVEACDYVLLMLINPGYADGKNERMVPYALEKIHHCKEFLKCHNSKAKIIVDGRVSLESIPKLLNAGADVLVAGSKSVFRKENSYAANYQQVNEIVNNFFKGGKHDEL